ncbi:MAG: ribosome-binding factor A [Opitutae bacterium]|jgi:ribosome-binding factor A|nr:ribosome-binding factor A [Opitutae bacterium]|tara:strand:- start:1301 stop:1702 length:402 start_codon:yes stop_codon:yes gene_type:complete
MGQRTQRVNELVKREISNYLHIRYRSECVRWTITSVDVSPDLRNGTVAYSVLGDETHFREAAAFFRKKVGEIRKEVGRHVVLKYSPKLRFVRDEGIERGNRVIEILEGLPETTEKDSDEFSDPNSELFQDNAP